jgi:hypothetical protein
MPHASWHRVTARANRGIAMRLSHLLVAPVLAVACTAPELWGCSSTSAPPVQDAASDSDASDAGAPPPAPNCAKDFVSSADVEVDSAGPDGQVHALSLLANESIYVVYNRPKAGAKNFEVYLRQFNCAGKPLSAPTRVSASDDNEVDPTAIWDGQQLLVMWAADTGAAVGNLRMRARLFDGNAVAKGGVVPIELTRAGKAVSGNTWMPALSKRSGGYWLSGAWGHDDAPGFQVFSQKLRIDGTPDGDGVDVALDPLVSQSTPSVATGADGKPIVVWSQEANAGNAGADTWISDASGARLLVKGPGAPEVRAAGEATWVTTTTQISKIGTNSPIALSANAVLPVLALGSSAPVAVAAYIGAGTRLPLRIYPISGGALGAGIDVEAKAATYPHNLTLLTDKRVALAYQASSGVAIRARLHLQELP